MWRFFLCISTCLAATREDLSVDIPRVTLTDHRGAAVSLPALLEGPVLVQFIFTTCPTICPVMVRAFAGIQQQLPGVRMVSISIDPEHDTPERLNAYAQELKAGPDWSLLTGRLEDVLAVQKAFDAYRGNKMRHEPVMYARFGDGWIRFHGLMPAGEAAAEIRRGLARPYAACESCHRKSGMGSSEGGVYVPPVTGEALFSAAGPRQSTLYPKLFQEAPPGESWARLRDPRTRPAYTVESLAAAIRTGRDPAGRELSSVMPRVAMTDRDVRTLATYLRTLGGAASGVTNEAVRFATVIAPDADPREASALTETISAYMRWKRTDTARRDAKPGPWDREAMRPVFREWKLDVWKLEGPETSWTEQLAARYRDQPPFAILMGMGRQAWRPMHEFCERTSTPCLFPITDRPVSEGANGYNLYFSRGLELEIEAAERSKGPDGQVVTAGPFPATGRILIPASLAAAIPEPARDRAYLVSAQAAPGGNSPHAFRARAWLRSRGLARDHEAIRLNAWFVMSLLDHSLMKMAGHFDRDYLIETIEMETENTANPGVYENLSLGPGQRFASKGWSVMKAAR